MAQPLSSVGEHPIESRDFDSVVVADKEGFILINTMQQDLVVTRNKFSDGTIEIWARPNRGGPSRLVIPRYDPETEQATCRHCGEIL